MNDVLDRLQEVLEQRRNADPAHSYVADLYQKGLDAILKKVGEEATETVIAAKGADREHLIHEIADLWFHTLVLLSQQDIDHREILDELARRFGVSGHEEKAGRANR